MQPNFKTKSGKRWYIVLKAFFFTVAALWLPICGLLAYTANDWWALVLLLLPLITYPLVVAWLVLFFCIRYIICIKTNKITWTSMQKRLAVLYIVMAFFSLISILLMIGSGLSLLESSLMMLYMLLPIPILPAAIAAILLEKKLARLNIDQQSE